LIVSTFSTHSSLYNLFELNTVTFRTPRRMNVTRDPWPVIRSTESAEPSGGPNQLGTDPDFGQIPDSPHTTRDLQENRS